VTRQVPKDKGKTDTDRQTQTFIERCRGKQRFGSLIKEIQICDQRHGDTEENKKDEDIQNCINGDVKMVSDIIMKKQILRRR